MFVCCSDESLQLHKEPGGTTAIVAVIKDGWIVCVSGCLSTCS